MITILEQWEHPSIPAQHIKLTHFGKTYGVHNFKINRHIATNCGLNNLWCEICHLNRHATQNYHYNGWNKPTTQVASISIGDAPTRPPSNQFHGPYNDNECNDFGRNDSL